MDIRGTAWLALLILTVGCSTTTRSGPRVGNEPRGIYLRVENTTTASLRIYARAGETELLLGRVRPLENAELRLPLGVRGSMTLVATATAGSHNSQPFGVSDGQWVVWRLQESPATSSVPRLSTIQVFSCDGQPAC